MNINFTLIMLAPFIIGLTYTIYDMIKKEKNIPKANSMKYSFIGFATSMITAQLFNFIL